MEVELLRARVRMAQDHLLRLQEHHGKWCDGVNSAFLSMQELCDELLKPRSASAISGAAYGMTGGPWKTPGTASQESLVDYDRGIDKTSQDLPVGTSLLLSGNTGVRPTLQPRVPLDEPLGAMQHRSHPSDRSKPSSAKGSPNAQAPHGSFDHMDYFMNDSDSVGHRSHAGSHASSRASSMQSVHEEPTSTSLLDLKYDPPAPREEEPPPLLEGETPEASRGEASEETQDKKVGFFRQMSPSFYQSAASGGSPSMYGALSAGFSAMLPVDEDMRKSRSSAALGAESPLRQRLDQAAGLLVTLNFFLMCWELEWQGYNLGAVIGVRGHEFQDITALRWTEMVFNFLFLAELLLRVYADRWDFLFELANWFDTLLVINSLADMYLFFAIELAGRHDVVSGTVIAAIATLRTIRIMRAMRLFRGLRLLLKACHAFLPTLGWSMVLLGVIMAMSGLLVGKMLQYFIAEEEEKLEDRIWVWQRYGTAYRSIYTLYEITFAGNWPSNVRPILEKVSHSFVVFFVLYITIVVFAAIRVITAVFLKDTLDAAQNDAEHQLAEGLKKKKQYVDKLEKFFKHIDHSGDGMITEDRLNEMLLNPRVKAYFETLDLAVHEGTALFHILDNGDGEVTLEEFIDGILRCKGPARAIDQVAMQAELKSLDQKISILLSWVQEGKVKPEGAQLVARRDERRKNTLTKDLKVFRLEDSVDTGSFRVSKVRSNIV